MNPLDLSHEGVLPKTGGAPTGVWENFDAVFEQTSKVDSTFGLERSVRDQWVANVEAYEKATGQAFQRNKATQEITSASEISQLIQPFLETDTGAAKAFLAGDFGSFTSPVMRESVERVRKINEALKQANDPRFKSLETLLEEALDEREQISARAADVTSRSGLGGTIGGFAGGVAGSFTTNDPLNILTATLGFGRTAAMRIASEIGIGVSVEGVNQGLLVSPTKQALGEDPADLSDQLLYAAAGALLFQGAAEGVGKLAQRLLPDAARSGDFQLDFNDPQMQGMFENAAAKFDEAELIQMLEESTSPRTRAMGMLLEDDAWARANNPYGDSDVALLRFTGELDAVARKVNGEADTAIGRVPGQNVSFELDELDLDLQTVRGEQPELWRQYEEAKQRVAELDGQISEISTRIDNVRVSEAVARFDPETAVVLAGYEDDLLKPGLTKKQRAAVEAKIDQILKSIGGDNWWAVVSKALNDATIEPKFELRATRASRKAAKVKLREQQKLIDLEVNKIKAGRRLLQLRKNAEASKGLARARAGRGPENLQATHPEVVSTHIATVTDLAPTIDDDFWDQLLSESGLFELPQRVEGKIVINGVAVDPTLPVPDLENPGKNISLDRALADLDEDRALVDSMRTCAV